MAEETTKEEAVKAEVVKAEETKTVDDVAAKTEDVPKKEETTVADAAALTDEDLEAVKGVKERLKFFFSDANVRQDMFVRKLLMDTDEKSVAVDVLLRFNTVKKHTDKPAVLIQAAKELTDSLVVDEEKMTISRVVPFTKEMMNQNIPKSLYIQNLPMKESKHYDVNVDEIRALFDKYGDVALVKLKFSTYQEGGNGGKDNYYGPNKGQKRKKIPIGAAMIEFHKQEDLDKAAEATLTTKGGEKVEPKDKITLAESETRKSATDLDIVLLSEYVASRKEKKEKRENKKRAEPEANADAADVKEEKEMSKFTFDWKPGCVIKVRGLPEGCDREAMLGAVGKGLDISPEDVKARKIYVDYSRGQTDGAIRFPEQSDSVAELAKKLKDGELMILDTKVEEALILEGEVEKKYWEDFIEFKNKQIIQRNEEKKNSRGNDRGNNRGGNDRGNNRGGNKRQKRGR